MLKKLLPAMGLALTVFAAHAAQAPLTVTELATGSSTKAAFTAMAKGHKLPAWVKKGGTATPARPVKLGDTQWQVFSACKPHDCASERMAVIYSDNTGKMAGVYSQVNARGDVEKLTWLGDDNTLSIDAKTVLLAALTGALENHPDAFNYP